MTSETAMSAQPTNQPHQDRVRYAWLATLAAAAALLVAVACGVAVFASASDALQSYTVDVPVEISDKKVRDLTGLLNNDLPDTNQASGFTFGTPAGISIGEPATGPQLHLEVTDPPTKAQVWIALGQAVLYFGIGLAATYVFVVLARIGRSRPFQRGNARMLGFAALALVLGELMSGFLLVEGYWLALESAQAPGYVGVGTAEMQLFPWAVALALVGMITGYATRNLPPHLTLNPRGKTSRFLPNK